MKKIAALLLATTALSAATSVSADVYDQENDQEAPFFWADPDAAAQMAPAEGPLGSLKDAPEHVPAAAIVTSPNPEDAMAQPATPSTPPAKPVNPMMEAYPEAEAPRHHVPGGGTAPSTFFDEDCRPGETAVGTAPRDQHLVDPALRRRGETVGDDGVLEAIQETPCAIIHRRGGPNAASREEYTDPSDIRRANTLEDRRIPVHEVGRYTIEGSSLWNRDPDSPFIDASRRWEVERGMMLSHMLMSWGEQAGFNVVWRSPHDYIVETDLVINGTFAEASGQVIESFANANPPIAADLFLNNRILVIDSASEFDGR